MDCEKFESTVLDELYGELDEVTSAAAKRHVAGCARCSSVLSGLRATRRVSVLPTVEPPADLEERILAAAREAQKVVPIGRRVSNFVSLAGSWAMRPQTAMAALFLLMIGSSALLLRSKSASHAPSSMQVSEQGEPVASVATDTLDRPPSDKGGVAGGDQAKDSKMPLPTLAPSAPTPTVAALPLSPASPPSGASSFGAMESLGGLASRAARGRQADSDGIARLRDSETGGGGAGAGPGAPPPQAMHYGTGNAYSAPAAANAPAPPAKAASTDTILAQAPSSDFDDAMNAYRAGDYATSTQLFDGVAKKGDLNAALWEARSVREASGPSCPASVAAMFDRVAQQGGASAVGYDAMFDAAKCYRALGQIDAARQRLSQLLLVPSYINRAQAELNAMNPKAAAKARPAQSQQATPPPQSSAGAY